MFINLQCPAAAAAAAAFLLCIIKVSTLHHGVLGVDG